MSSSKEEQESLPAIDYPSHLKFKNLKSNQDKLSNNCPRLPVLEQNIERWYTYYTNKEITYLDYTHCVNETRLPLLWTLHSNRTLFWVSFCYRNTDSKHKRLVLEHASFNGKTPGLFHVYVQDFTRYISQWLLCIPQTWDTGKHLQELDLYC
jgi:hypothetical protein